MKLQGVWKWIAGALQSVVGSVSFGVINRRLGSTSVCGLWLDAEDGLLTVGYADGFGMSHSGGVCGLRTASKKVGTGHRDFTTILSHRGSGHGAYQDLTRTAGRAKFGLALPQFKLAGGHIFGFKPADGLIFGLKLACGLTF